MFQRCGTKSHLKGGEEMKYEVDLKQRLYSITEKYVVLVEKRIDEIEKLTGKDLEDIYTSIQRLMKLAQIRILYHPYQFAYRLI